jgi:phytoene dehydrogenase-like protein
MAKKIIIVGGGISGLTAGCYLQMNGYDTEIYEMHSLPGGLCTAWDRQGYTFDGCIHWFVGSKKDDSFYKLWNEIIDMESLRFYEGEEYFRIIGDDNKPLIIYRDINKLEQTLLSIAKEKTDATLIKNFCNAARRLTNLEMPVDKARETMNMLDGIKMMLRFMPYMSMFKKWIKISGEDFAKQFKNPLLQKAFELMFVPEMSTLFLVFTIAWMSKKNAGYPLGGSMNFARMVEKSYLDLNGKIHYNSKVSKIITENDSAKGIILENGEKLFADIIISAADGHFTIFEMLEGKYTDKTVNKIYNEYPIFPSYLQISLGIGRTFENQPGMLYFLLENPIKIDDTTSTSVLGFRIFNFDQSMAPEGKTSVICVIGTYNYEYWLNLKKSDFNKYKSEKQRIADELINVLESKLGNIKQHVEVVDVSTPSTVVRYTNNWKGSLEGWIMSPKVGLKSIKKELPGLKNFYMIGQWVEPGGGIPSCIQSGRGVAQIICKRDKKKFYNTKIHK